MCAAADRTQNNLLCLFFSRSHSLFSVTTHIKENSVSGEELLKIGKLNLVSLDCPSLLLYTELNSNRIDVCYYKLLLAYFCARLNLSILQLSLKVTG